jgi:ABC-2 type transport system permease protein
VTWYRVWAIFTRHFYLYKRSLARWMAIFYWPLIDLFVWGFITVYLRQSEALATGGKTVSFVMAFLGALILWDILFRSQQGISITFLEEVWSRNLLNLFVSPLRPIEFLTAAMLMGLFMVTTATLASALLAWLFYSFNLLTLGVSLLPFILNLVAMGWAIGVVTTAIILRFGQKAEVVAWGLTFFFQPISAVFYPVEVLPPWLQPIARAVPATHVFQGMRQLLHDGTFPLGELLAATALNGIYLSVAFAFFYWIFGQVKVLGLLLKVGE